MRNKMLQFSDGSIGLDLLLAGDLKIIHDNMLDGLGQFADYLGFSTIMGPSA